MIITQSDKFKEQYDPENNEDQDEEELKKEK